MTNENTMWSFNSRRSKSPIKSLDLDLLDPEERQWIQDNPPSMSEEGWMQFKLQPYNEPSDPEYQDVCRDLEQEGRKLLGDMGIPFYRN